MSFAEQIRPYFRQLADAGFAELKSGEELNLQLIGEDQTYLRFNDARLRQATGVRQANLSVNFQAYSRKLSFAFDLTGHLEQDSAILDSLLRRARQESQVLPEDPYVVSMQDHGTSEEVHLGRLPDPESVAEFVARYSGGTGFTGLFASGLQFRAVCNSSGMDHWFSSESYFLDYSLFTRNASGEDKAVKNSVSAVEWNQEQVLSGLDADKERLRSLERPTHALAPGDYRVYFSPAAVSDLLDMFSWGALSYKAWKEGGCALRSLIEGKETLSPQFTLRENFRLALLPRFNSLGELPPMDLTVIEAGKLKELLVSSRTAKEYGAACNFAEPGGWFGEHLRSAELETGDLPEAEALHRLGKGLFIGNLHYLNWSDVQTARITGMTRYACFWVVDGEIVAPIRDLRFDDSLYRLFGTNLEALTAESHVRRSVDTYHRRALGGNRAPGALVSACRFTL